MLLKNAMGHENIIIITIKHLQINQISVFNIQSEVDMLLNRLTTLNYTVFCIDVFITKKKFIAKNQMGCVYKLVTKKKPTEIHKEWRSKIASFI